MVELTVQKVVYDPQHQRAVVLLQDRLSRRYLPIIVGMAEAGAIAMAIEGIEPPRPQTHDLLKAILDRLGVTIAGILIDDVREDTFLAQISLDSPTGALEVDARPSDAIALALRAKATIRAMPRVMEIAGTTVEEGPVQ